MSHILGKKKEIDFLLEQMSGVVATYQDYFQQQLANTKLSCKNTKEKKHYPFIPSGSPLNVAKALLELRRYFVKKNPYKKGVSDHKRYYMHSPKPMYIPRFVDCGCGIGNIALIAKYMGYQSYGIEYNEEAVAVAKRLVAGWCIDITQGDISSYREYSKFDLIYFYIPMCSHDKMKRFINKVAKHARIGAVIISFGGYSCGGRLSTRDKRFKQLKLKHGVGSTLVKVSD